MKRLLKWLASAFVLALVALLGFAGWLLGTEDGLRWALGHAPEKLVAEGAHGRLAGTIGFERLAYDVIVEARDVELRISLVELAGGTLAVQFLRAAELSIALPERKGQGGGVQLPLRVRVSDARIDRLRLQGYELRNLRLDYSGDAAGHRLKAAFSAFGAEVTAQLEPSDRVTLEVQKLDLAAIRPGLPHTALGLRLEGRSDLRSSLSGVVSASNGAPGPLDRERLPLARLSASFATDFRRLELKALEVQGHPHGRASGKGAVAADLTSLDLNVRDLDLRAIRSNLRSTRLAGPVKLLLEPARQRLQGTLAQADLSLTGDVQRSGELIEIKALRARAAAGEAEGSARVRLGAAPTFEAALRFARFDPSQLGDYPAGSLNGTARASGRIGEPRRIEGRWTITNSMLLGQPFESSGEARLSGERVTGADARLRLGANRVALQGSFGGRGDQLAWSAQIPELGVLLRALNAGGLDGQVRASGTASGTLEQPRLALTAQASPLRLPNGATLDTVVASGTGTLEQHELDLTAESERLELVARFAGGWSEARWRGELLALENSGDYPFELGKPATLEIGARRVALGPLEGTLAGSRVSVEGLRWEDGHLTSAGAFAALPAQFLIALAKMNEQVSSTLLLDGEWSLVSTPQLNGRLSVRRASGDLALATGGGGAPDMELALQRATLDARFNEGRVAAAIEIVTGIGTLRAEGEAEGLTPESAVAFSATLESADLLALSEPLWTQARMSGRVSATLRGSGTLGNPIVSGTLQGDGLAVDVPPYGIYLTEGRLRAGIERDRLMVTELTIRGGDGRFTARGALPLRLAAGGAKLEWTAERFRVLNRPDMRLVVSGQGSLGFDGRKLALEGELRADSGRFELTANRLPELSEDIVIVGQESAPRRKPARLPLDLDLRLDLGNDLQARGSPFEGRIAGQVRVFTSSAGELFASGRVRSVNGKLYAFGQPLEVDPGELIFDGPITNPSLQVTAWRRHQQVEAGVLVSGSLSAPRIELVSNPPVTEGEKLSWLVLGRPPSDASGADLSVLQAAAGVLLGRGDAVPLNRRIANAVGLDELTIRGSSELPARPGPAGGPDVPARVVAVGKRLSDRLYLSFEQGLGATIENLVKLDLSLTQRVSLRAQTGTTSGMGLFYRFSWD